MGVTIIAILTFCAAAILAVGSVAFFVVAVMGMTGADSEEPVSVAIAGMGVAGGFSLLVLAGIAVCLAMGVLKLCGWARIVSIVSTAIGVGCSILSITVFRGYVLVPLVPSLVCHLLLMATAVWMLAYLLRPQVKRTFLRGVSLSEIADAPSLSQDHSSRKRNPWSASMHSSSARRWSLYDFEHAAT